jgi:uncharacterized protein YqeY
MNLEQKITEELKSAMKAQNKVRIEAIRSIRSAIIEFNKSGIGHEMTEEEGLKMLNTLAKRRKESIEMFEKGNRPELAEKERLELAIIQEFLPKQLTEEEATVIIKNLITEQNATAKDFGKVMGMTMKLLSGKFDGAKVQSILKELLK